MRTDYFLVSEPGGRKWPPIFKVVIMEKDEKNLLTVAFWIGLAYFLVFIGWVAKCRLRLF